MTERKYTPQETIQIYTDWANHYLDKARSKKRVNCLATDCSDGVLLAEVIESVTCQKIPDINRKPKTPSQMLDNVNLCLGVLRAQHVAGIESISGQDLRDGRLKAILALFFALSRHKQAAKQKNPQQNAEMTPSRSSAIPHKGASSIPLPGSALPSRKCPPDKVRPMASSSRASSPALSMIPRGPPAPNNSPYQQPKTQQSPQQQNQQNQQNSLLKLFKTPTTNDRTTPTSNGKRTSSSSGVSSARSEKSDSSASIEPNVVDIKRGNVKGKQQRVVKAGGKSNSPNSNKKEMMNGGVKVIKTSQEVERHATKVASLNSKLAEPKIRVNQGKNAQEKNGPISPNTGIPKPTAAVKGTSKPKTPMVSRESSQASISRPTVALVSPIKVQEQETTTIETTESNNTNGDNFIKSEPNQHHQQQPQEKIIKDKDIFDYQENISSKKQQPYHQHHQNDNLIRRNHNQGDDEPTGLNVEPMRPLFREYCSTLTLPSRNRHYPRIQPDGGDYCEISLANGYLSDGEVLRNPMNREQICDGYMSEGGSALYARRLQTMPAHIPGGNAPSPSPATSRIPGGLAALTEAHHQGARRARGPDAAAEPPPRASGRAPAPQRANGAHHQHQQHQQHHQQQHQQQAQQWKRYGDSPGVGSPPPPPPPAPPPPAPASPSSARRKQSPQAAGGASKGDKGKARGGGGGGGGQQGGFAYGKRGGAPPPATVNGTTQTGIGLQGQSGKTAQVSAVPRTKVKVSGGTQTCSSDLQPHKNPQFKSFSLTGNAATQLSQSVRERLMMHGSQSLPKGAGQEYGLVMRQVRPKASDGSLSDTQAIENTSPYAPWLRHSNTYSVAPRLSETDSMESLSSLPGHRGSLTHARLLRDSPSRLSRSNSIRSTKSEKLYPSMLHRNAEPETEPYYCLPVGAVLNHWSQPTSPAPGAARTFPLSPTHATPRHSIPKNDDVHGSSISLVSTASSLYSSAEEKHAHEIRKLRRELMEAQEKVQTLTSQLSTNAHVVAAFEQSLSSMTQRLQHLTATSEKKDSELAELRSAMESLRVQSLQAGIGTGLARQPSSDSVSSLSSACSLDKQEKKKKKGWLRSSFTKAFSRNAKVTKVQCQSEEIERQQSPPPPAPTDTGAEVAELQKQLREKDLVLTDIRLEALSSAHQLESLKDTVMKMRSEMLSLKQNNERLQRMVSGTMSNGGTTTVLSQDMSESRSLDHLAEMIPVDEPPPEVEPDGKRIVISVYLGQPQTFERYYQEHYDNDRAPPTATGELAIAHTTVGAATTWPQLDAAVRRAFKRHVARLDPGGGLGLGADAIASYKLGEAARAFDPAPSPAPPDLLPVGYAVGRVAALHVVLQPVAAFAFEALVPKGVAQRLASLLAEHRRVVLCGAPGTGKTHLAARLAEFHAQSLGRDPAEAVATFNSLSFHIVSYIGKVAIAGYKLGEVARAFDPAPSPAPPDLLPVGYAVGRVAALHVVLQPVAAFAFEALVPKGVAQRLASLLAEHRRVVLCGAPGTGKTHLAARLAEFHAQSLGRDPAEAVATFNYKLGEAARAFDPAPSPAPPDLLPVGYAVGRVAALHVVLQPVAAFAFEALVPKGVAQRLASLLAEHRRVVLCGAPGTGKTHLAARLAEFHAQSLGRDPAEAVATFNVDNKSGKELRQYLAHLSEQAAAGDNSVLPCVVVLDNLHKAGPLADALGSLPRNLPCLLGTMAQSACSATSLQLQHGFRWVLVAPHMEPARGLLGRVLRRRLASLELERGPRPELAAILGWLPRVWQHLNAHLETHSSGDVAIGPRLFLGCPLELDAARAWFADVWNYSLAPYLREAAREGLQLYGRRAAWTDPCQFVLDTYPWPGAPPQGLTAIPAKDVGLEGGAASERESEGDPLLNMLMRLQEAANYSSPHSNDSDCNSLDSNMTHGSNLGTESVS